MKVLHILDHSIPLHSGYTFRTRSILKQQQALGWKTCQVTSPKHGEFDSAIEDVEGLRFYRTPVPNGLLSKLPAINQLALVPPMRNRILQAIEAEKPDILHAHSPALNGLAALQAGRKAGIPVVYEIRAFWEDAAVDHGTCKEWDVRYRLTRKLETYVASKANQVTTICEGLKGDLLERGIENNKITVIPNAVNIEQFDIIEHKDSELLTSLGLSDSLVMGFLGSFYAYEGLDLLVSAMPLILKKIPNAKLLLVGGGPQEATLKQQVSTLGLEKHVVMTGRVPHADISRYYSLVDLLVYPRKSMRLTELVTPLKPLEAMAQGKLVAASNVGGHRELIDHEETGWLFESNSAKALAETAINVLSSTDVRAQIQAGRQYVEQVRNWPNSVSRYQDVYARCLNV